LSSRSGPGQPSSNRPATQSFLATVGLRIDPAAINSGTAFRLGRLSALPFSFWAVEDTVRETLQQGIYGWRVTDAVVTMTHSGYWPRQATHTARLTAACRAPPGTSATRRRWA
jgi:hypothetical protein